METMELILMIAAIWGGAAACFAGFLMLMNKRDKKKDLQFYDKESNDSKQR